MYNRLIKTIKIILSAVLFLLPWQTIWITQEQFLNGSKWEYGTLGFYATEILLWLCIVLFIIWFIKKKKLQATSYKLQATKDRLFIFSLIIFVFYVLLSSLWSINSDIAYQHGLHIMEATILFLMIFAGPLNFKKAAGWFIAGASLQSILGIWQFFTQSTFTFKWLGLVSHPVWQAGTSIINDGSSRWLRAYGAFPHPNILGGYLAISLILTFLLFFKENNKKLFIIYYLLFISQIMALFVTFSRSAWIAFAVFIIGTFTYGLKNKNKQILSIINYQLLIITILTIIFFPLVQTRFSHNSTNEIKSTTERLSGYREAWAIFKEYPILGVGAGNYTAPAYQLNLNLPGYAYQPVHSVPLLILVELGIVGAILLILIIISFTNYHLSIIIYQKLPYYLLFTIYYLLLIFDHYLFSSYPGLLLSGVFFALILKFKHS